MIENNDYFKKQKVYIRYIHFILRYFSNILRIVGSHHTLNILPHPL